jgi:hypothetical protein
MENAPVPYTLPCMIPWLPSHESGLQELIIQLVADAYTPSPSVEGHSVHHLTGIKNTWVWQQSAEMMRVKVPSGMTPH